ncbi:MAG: serine/threonine-protein kinase, partial [Myxococcota bacterium]
MMTHIPRQLGPYRVLDTLGRGGQGVVYRAEHLHTGRQVAIKTMVTPSESALLGLRREIHTLSAMEHPCVVRFVDQGFTDPQPWCAMEYIDGDDLLTYCQAHLQRHSNALAHVWTLFAELAMTLAYLHGRGVIHRDLKPSNVLVDGSGKPVVVDFGLTAKVMRDSHREILASDPLSSGGTLAFSPPEALRGELADIRFDVYAFGVMLFYALSGTLPFATIAQVLRSKTEPPRLSSVTSIPIPHALDTLMSKLLANDPVDRLAYMDLAAQTLMGLGAQPRPEVMRQQPRPFLCRPGFVGRTRLLRGLLRRIRQNFTHRNGELLVLEGASGMGKTRLVLEATRKLELPTLRLLTSECPHPDLETPAPMQAFEGLFQHIGDRLKLKDDSMDGLLEGWSHLLRAF